MTEENKFTSPDESDPTASVSGDLGKLLEERERLEELLRQKYTKNITVMFTDMKGSTDLADTEGNLAARLLIKHHNDIVFPVIEKQNGHLVKTMGDGTLSYFNTAQDAVRCGIVIQQNVAEFNRAKNPKVPIQVRIGIHTGQGLVEKKDIYGDVVNVASRIESQASAGEVYLSEETFHAMTDQNEIYCSFQKIASLKGKKEPFRIFKAFWIPEEIEADKKAPKAITVEEKKKAASTSSILSESQKVSFEKSSAEVAKESSATGPTIIIEEAGQPKRVVHLCIPETLIGRQADCDVILDESYISRHHAKITANGEVYTIEDLGSRMGTYVNGDSITKKELRSGDEIRLGELRVTYVGPVAEAKKEPAFGAGEAAATMMFTKKLKLAVYGPDKQIVEFPITSEEKIIGRSAESAIRLNDNLVSRHHAKVWEENGFVYIEDLGSNNGTLVEGGIIPKSEPILLREGALVTISAFRLKLMDVLDKADPAMFAASQPAPSILGKMKNLWDKGAK